MFIFIFLSTTHLVYVMFKFNIEYFWQFYGSIFIAQLQSWEKKKLAHFA